MKRKAHFRKIKFANMNAPDDLLNTGVGRRRKRKADLYGISGSGKIVEDLHL